MSSAGNAPPARGSVRRVIWLCLLLQAGIGLAVVLEASRDLVPADLFAPTAPAFVPGQPVAPDDQRRRFRPGDLPASPAPGTGPAIPGDMPEILTPEPVEGRPGIFRLTGAIDAGASARVERFLADTEAAPETILLHSPGGLVNEALAIGQALREAEIATGVEAGGICFSACPYMLAGGIERRVDAQAAVGVHQSYYDQAAYLPLFVGVSDVQRGEAAAMRFLIEMGVDPLVRIPALETPPADIYVLTEQELLDYRLATEVLPAAR